MNVVMIPSVSGGLGHIGRTAALGRRLVQLAPEVSVEYLLDAERLRPFNIDAAARTGFRVNMLPTRPREGRDAMVRAALGHADVIVDDTQRHLIPLRLAVPGAAWVSIPMYPLWDELYMDWPLLLQTDAVLWAYPPALDFPKELELLGPRVHRVGPFLEVEGVPDRAEARRRLGIEEDEEVVVYSPRGMSFGREFGETVLAGVVGAVKRLRAKRPRLRLLLLAVSKPDELRAPGVPAPLPRWATTVGVVPPEEMLVYLRAADIALTEGSNMTQEAAALGTPVVMVPGTIYETWLLGTRLHENEAAHVIWIERVTPKSVADAFKAVLNDPSEREAMAARAKAMVSGGGGVEAAARLVLELGRKKRRAFEPASGLSL